MKAFIVWKDGRRESSAWGGCDVIRCTELIHEKLHETLFKLSHIDPDDAWIYLESSSGPVDFPDLNETNALECDWGVRKLYEFMNGDNDASPDVYDNLSRTREHAAEIAKRALQYVAKCDAVKRDI